MTTPKTAEEWLYELTGCLCHTTVSAHIEYRKALPIIAAIMDSTYAKGREDMRSESQAALEVVRKSYYDPEFSVGELTAVRLCAEAIRQLPTEKK